MKYSLQFPCNNGKPEVYLLIGNHYTRDFNDVALECIITHLNKTDTYKLVIKSTDDDDLFDAKNIDSICSLCRTIKAVIDDFDKPIELHTKYSLDDLYNKDNIIILELLNYINLIVTNNCVYRRVLNTFVLDQSI